MISVIIPTYKSVEHLDLCLSSAIKGQVNKNQLIIVVDGTIDIVKSVLDKYDDDIDILDMQTNQGLCRATNFLLIFDSSTTSISMIVILPTPALAIASTA